MVRAKKAQKVAIPKHARRHELMRAALDSGVTQVRANLRLARSGDEPEAIHQLRVGVRRLRVCLRLFEKPIGGTRRAQLEPELRWIFRSLGATRDYDVLIGELEALVDESSARDGLRTALVRSRARVARKTQRDLQSARFQSLVRALRRLSIELAANEPASPRARKWAKKRIQKRLDAVLAGREALEGDDPEALHELRKDLKKLRYTADVVSSLFPEKRTKRYLRCLSTLQDTLGPINDAAVGERLLMETAVSLPVGPARAARRARGTLAQRATSARPVLVDEFAKFAEKKPFWR